MSTEHEAAGHGYVLGEDVTAIAKARKQTGTVVVSVRLSVDEVARLENIGICKGKSVSQLIRDAVSVYNPYADEWSLTFSDPASGTRVSLGQPRQESRGRELILVELEPPA